MPNVKAMTTEKTVQKKRYPSIINILTESIRATTSKKRILNFDINLTVGKWLASILPVKK